MAERDQIYVYPGFLGPEQLAALREELDAEKWKRARTAQKGAQDSARTNSAVGLAP